MKCSCLRYTSWWHSAFLLSKCSCPWCWILISNSSLHVCVCICVCVHVFIQICRCPEYIHLYRGGSETMLSICPSSDCLEPHFICLIKRIVLHQPANFFYLSFCFCLCNNGKEACFFLLSEQSVALCVCLNSSGLGNCCHANLHPQSFLLLLYLWSGVPMQTRSDQSRQSS